MSHASDQKRFNEIVSERLRVAEWLSAYMRELTPYKKRRASVMKFRTWEDKEAWEAQQAAADFELGGS